MAHFSYPTFLCKLTCTTCFYIFSQCSLFHCYITVLVKILPGLQVCLLDIIIYILFTNAIVDFSNIVITMFTISLMDYGNKCFIFCLPYKCFQHHVQAYRRLNVSFFSTHSPQHRAIFGSQPTNLCFLIKLWFHLLLQCNIFHFRSKAKSQQY